LDIFDVSFNDITALPSSITQLTGLHVLDLEENDLTLLPLNI
jgi:Leucine-rich repeat (LRR) protein